MFLCIMLTPGYEAFDKITIFDTVVNNDLKKNYCDYGLNCCIIAAFKRNLVGREPLYRDFLEVHKSIFQKNFLFDFLILIKSISSEIDFHKILTTYGCLTSSQCILRLFFT